MEGGLRLNGHVISSSDDMPLVSVVTVVFNNQITIERCINSVLNQSYPCIEYIIVDGGSSDGTLDIIMKYSERIDYFVSEPDEGLYNAMMALCPETKNGATPVVLVPNPFYQVYAVAALSVGAEPVFLPCTKETGFLPDFASVDPKILGGFILRVGDVQYDASIANKLLLLKREFDNESYIPTL